MLTSGCASVMESKLEPVSVQTVLDNQQVSGVGCTLTNDVGKWFVTSPGTVTVNKSYRDMSVDCSKDGVGNGHETVASKSNGGAWGNIVAGGVIGYVVDRNTGAGFDYPTNITVILTKVGAIPLAPSAGNSKKNVSTAEITK